MGSLLKVVTYLNLCFDGAFWIRSSAQSLAPDGADIEREPCAAILKKFNPWLTQKAFRYYTTTFDA